MVSVFGWSDCIEFEDNVRKTCIDCIHESFETLLKTNRKKYTGTSARFYSRDSEKQISNAMQGRFQILDKGSKTDLFALSLRGVFPTLDAM